MDFRLVSCLAIFVLSMASYLWRRIPMAVTAVAAMALYHLTGCIDARTALSGFANPNTIMIASVFIVAEAFGRTGFIRRLASLVSRVSHGSPRKAMAGYCLMTALLSQFIQSPSAAFVIVAPIVVAGCREMGTSPSKAVFPIGLVAIATCGVLPIGTSATNYALLNGYLQMFDYAQYQFRVWDIALARLPAMVFVLVWCAFFADRLAPALPAAPPSGAAGAPEGLGGGASRPPLSPFHERCAVAVFVLVSLSLLLSPVLDIPHWAVCLAGAILVVALGVLKEEEAYRAIPSGMLVLYAGSLAAGAALSQTGAGDLVGGLLASFGSRIDNTFLFYAIFFFVPFVLTQFMNNLALLNIFTPVAIMAAKALAVSPVGLCLLVQAAALCAFMTPMATATAPMMMALGGYDMRSMFRQGLLPGVAIWLISALWASVVFPIAL